MFNAVFIKEEKVLLKMLRDIFDINSTEQVFTMLGYETAAPKFKGKSYIGDILIKLSDKSYVLVEMNYNNNISATDRNLVQLTRIHSQILKEREDDEELSKYRLRGLNFNNFRNLTGKPVENFAVCNLENNKIATMMYTFCNIDIEKCKKMVYDIFCVEDDIAYEEFIKDCVLKLYDDFNILVIYSECCYYNIRIIDGYEQDIMFDNLEQMSKIIENEIKPDFLTDEQFVTKKIKLLNIETFDNENKDMINKYVLMNEQGKVISDFVMFLSINIANCYSKVCNSVDEKENISNDIRWGAILNCDIEELYLNREIFGDSLLDNIQIKQFFNFICSAISELVNK